MNKKDPDFWNHIFKFIFFWIFILIASAVIQIMDDSDERKVQKKHVMDSYVANNSNFFIS